jgi:hypothetical protein
MNRLITHIAVNTALLAALVAAGAACAQTAAESGYAQPREAYEHRAPAYADDSCQTGEYGPPVRVKPGDVVEDGKIVGRDPDPNIRAQLEREDWPEGSECR